MFSNHTLLFYHDAWQQIELDPGRFHPTLYDTYVTLTTWKKASFLPSCKTDSASTRLTSNVNWYRQSEALVPLWLSVADTWEIEFSRHGGACQSTLFFDSSYEATPTGSIGMVRLFTCLNRKCSSLQYAYLWVYGCIDAFHVPLLAITRDLRGLTIWIGLNPKAALPSLFRKELLSHKPEHRLLVSYSGVHK
jgi:hypothetical protein